MTALRGLIGLLVALALALGPIAMPSAMAAPTKVATTATTDDGGSPPMPCCSDSDAANMPTMVCGLNCPAASIVPTTVAIDQSDLGRRESSPPPVILSGRVLPPDPFPPKYSH